MKLSRLINALTELQKDSEHDPDVVISVNGNMLDWEDSDWAHYAGDYTDRYNADPSRSFVSIRSDEPVDLPMPTPEEIAATEEWFKQFFGVEKL